MYKVCINMKDVSEHETQKEAVKAFMASIKEKLDAGGFTYQALETMCWIENNGGKVFSYQIDPVPMYFYGIRDLAHENNWINDKGEWIA